MALVTTPTSMGPKNIGNGVIQGSSSSHIVTAHSDLKTVDADPDNPIADRSAVSPTIRTLGLNGNSTYLAIRAAFSGSVGTNPVVIVYGRLSNDSNNNRALGVSRDVANEYVVCVDRDADVSGSYAAAFEIELDLAKVAMDDGTLKYTIEYFLDTTGVQDAFAVVKTAATTVTTCILQARAVSFS